LFPRIIGRSQYNNFNQLFISKVRKLVVVAFETFGMMKGKRIVGI